MLQQNEVDVETEEEHALRQKKEEALEAGHERIAKEAEDEANRLEEEVGRLLLVLAGSCVIVREFVLHLVPLVYPPILLALGGESFQSGGRGSKRTGCKSSGGSPKGKACF